MLKTNVEWIAWGEADPMFGVAAWRDRTRSGNHPWTAAEFYALGISDWADFRQLWEKYHPLGGTVLEIGCGAGRMTNAMAETFENVVAVDVSPGMLMFAREHVAKANIRWIETAGDCLPMADDAADAVFSCHVFQHLPSPDAIIDQLREVHRVLRPGGGLCIHLHVHAFPAINRLYATPARALYSAFLKVTTIKAAIRRRLGPYMHGVSIELPILLAGMDEIGFPDARVATVRMKSNGIHHLCLVAEKSAN
jgi:SAM-dependent methyltransferase